MCSTGKGTLSGAEAEAQPWHPQKPHFCSVKTKLFLILGATFEGRSGQGTPVAKAELMEPHLLYSSS